MGILHTEVRTLDTGLYYDSPSATIMLGRGLDCVEVCDTEVLLYKTGTGQVKNGTFHQHCNNNAQ